MRFVLFPILLPLAVLYAVISFIRSKLYDWDLIESVAVSAKVVCVGNITAGGTGKTPLIRWLSLELLKRGKRVCVLSRGYKRTSNEILKVNPMSADVKKFGDEPLQLAKQVKGVSVFVGADRVKAAKKIIAEENPDVILLDDGFQHRRLKRDFDFVVLDATQPKWHYWPLPLGFGREGFWALKRASAIILTKVNLVTGSDLQSLLKGKKVVEFSSHLSRLRTLDGEIWSLERLRGEKVALMSAIGRPASFEKQVKDLGVEVVFHRIFSDHHEFRSWEIKSLLKKADKQGVDRILVTEKDAVKLGGFDLPKDRVLIAELEVEMRKGKEELDQFFSGLFS